VKFATETQCTHKNIELTKFKIIITANVKRKNMKAFHLMFLFTLLAQKAVTAYTRPQLLRLEEPRRAMSDSGEASLLQKELSQKEAKR
jgi:hypothetical protein